MPLVADFFADADTREIAHACRKVDDDLKRGFRWSTLGPALETLAAQAPSPLLGVVCGAGFEDRTGLDFDYVRPRVMHAARAGMLEDRADRWRASPLGWRFLNDVIAGFLPAEGPGPRVAQGVNPA